MCCIVPNNAISLSYQIKGMKKHFLKSLLVLTLFCSFGVAASGQETGKNSELYTEIARMDSLMFTAFNNRDLNSFKKLFTQDLEFYHDKGGLTGYEHTINFLKSTADNKQNDLTRRLVPGTLEVYPIKDYGAIEIGAHQFCHTENGKQDCGTFKFLHVWKKTEEGWKVTRVVSYDH